MDMFFDILIMGCGVYMIYWAVQMKRLGKIPQMLVGKGFKLEKAKDPQGFIRFTFPLTFGLGAVLFGAGLYMSLTNGSTDTLNIILNASMSMVLVVVVIIYGVLLMKAQKKYLVGLKDKNKDAGK